jgi:hypothetical protein
MNEVVRIHSSSIIINYIVFFNNIIIIYQVQCFFWTVSTSSEYSYTQTENKEHHFP